MRLDIEGLRAVAVLLVLCFHAELGPFTGGYIGVDVFFVISGFIITRQLAQEMDDGSFSYVAFLGRRIRRLIPAALVCSMLTTVVAALLLMPDALKSFGESKLIETGLLVLVEEKEPYDRFRGRVMIPIEDQRGRVIAFGGRILDKGQTAPIDAFAPDALRVYRTLVLLRSGPGGVPPQPFTLVERGRFYDVWQQTR